MQGVSVAVVALASLTPTISTLGVGTPPLGDKRASLSLRTRGVQPATTALSEGAPPPPEEPDSLCRENFAHVTKSMIWTGLGATCKGSAL